MSHQSFYQTENRQRSPKLLDRVRAKMRARHYSRRTEDAYVGWIRDFILYNGKGYPKQLGRKEVEGYLSHLAVGKNVAASTQNQALAAILFLYKQVLEIDLPWIENVTRAKRTRRLPVVLTEDEVRKLLTCLESTPALMAALMYGSGLRLMECARLRVKDVDFALHQN